MVVSYINLVSLIHSVPLYIYLHHFILTYKYLIQFYCSNKCIKRINTKYNINLILPGSRMWNHDYNVSVSCSHSLKKSTEPIPPGQLVCQKGHKLINQLTR